MKVELVANPAPQGSVEAHWGSASDGSPLLSWIEPMNGGSFALRYSVWHATQWSEARTIVANRHFFRQPAESRGCRLSNFCGYFNEGRQKSYPDTHLAMEWDPRHLIFSLFNALDGQLIKEPVLY